VEENTRPLIYEVLKSDSVDQVWDLLTNVTG